MPGEQNIFLLGQPNMGTGGFRSTLQSYAEGRSYLVGHRFKKDGRSRDFLLICHEPVGQMASIGQIQAHDASMGFYQGSVHCKVGRGPWAGQTRRGTIASAHEAASRTPNLATRPPNRSGQNRHPP